MSQINQFLLDLGRFSDAVKKSTRPLYHLGVTCFYYLSINHKGDHFLLTDCPHVDEYYYQEKLYLKDPYVRHPDNYQSGLFFFESNQKQDFDQSLAYLARTFRISPLVGLCEKQKDFVEFFGFWGEADKSLNFEHIYLNYANLLKAYAAYFKQQYIPVLKMENAPYLCLRELIGPDLFDYKSPSKPNFDSVALRKYLLEMGCSTEVAQADALSSREKECMKLLLHGKSAKDMGMSLDLSPRTIEHYLDNIKTKLNCHFRSELFSISERLNKLELI